MKVYIPALIFAISLAVIVFTMQWYKYIKLRRKSKNQERLSNASIAYLLAEGFVTFEVVTSNSSFIGPQKLFYVSSKYSNENINFVINWHGSGQINNILQALIFRDSNPPTTDNSYSSLFLQSKFNSDRILVTEELVLTHQTSK